MLAAALLTLGSARTSLNTWKENIGTGLGNQLQTVATGLSAYISANSAALVANTAVTGVANKYVPTIAELKTLGYLNSAVQAAPTAGTAYVIKISLTPTGCTTNCTPTGYVYLQNPIVGPDGKVGDTRLLSAAMNASKTNQVGFSLFNGVSATTTSITGNGWTLTNPDPAQRPGILYATTALSGAPATGGSGTSTQYWLKSAANKSALPSTGNTIGDGRLAQDTAKPYMWNGSAWSDLFYINSSDTVSLGPSAGNGGTGWNQTFIGGGAGSSNTSGTRNTFVGTAAGRSNTTGYDNVFLGTIAGIDNVSGESNTFLGAWSGRFNTSGGSNTFIGESSGYSNTTGYSNFFSGKGAGYSNTTGAANVFVGAGAGGKNTIGSGNVFTGTNAGYYNTTGYSNLFIGGGSGFQNTSGSANVYLGNSSGGFYSGSYNLAIGDRAAGSASTGNYNVILGKDAGYIASGDGNVFIGKNAGSGAGNTYGSVVIGDGAARTPTNGSVYIGSSAGKNDISFGGNTFIGNEAGKSNLNGKNNTFTGGGSGANNTSGDSNSFYGDISGFNNTAGSSNVFFGVIAGNGNTTGNSNVAIGFGAGLKNKTGSGNVFFGNLSDASADGFMNSMALGNQSIVTSSNQVRIGNTSISSIGGAVAWSNLSDQRLKTDIKDSVYGLDFVRKLRPVDYTLKDNKKHETGFIAQEVEKIDATFPGVNKPANDKDFYSFTYTDFIPSMVKSIQELDARTLSLQPAASNDSQFGQPLVAVLASFFALLIGLVVWLNRKNKALNQRLTALEKAIAQNHVSQSPTRA